MGAGSSATNIFQNPGQKLGNYDQQTQNALQNPWLSLLGQASGGQSIQTGAAQNGLSSGSMSLADAIKAVQGGENAKNPGGQQGAMNALFSSPQTGTTAATQQVQSNPMFSGMFGAGGIQDQRQAAEKDLMGRGYSLQPEDNEAYGQASNNIARQYGNYENNLSQALASKGLSGGGGGPAVAFSGLQGNKLEALAGQQRQIAEQRMQTNMQRLNNMQQAVNQSNAQGQDALNSQRNANLEGIQAGQNQLKDAMQVGLDVNSANSNAYQQEQSSRVSPGAILGGIVTGGLGAAAGGLGSAVGAGLGKSITGGASAAMSNAPTNGVIGPPAPQRWR